MILNRNIKVYLKCIDIDECSITHGVCGPGKCRNINGGFECDCNEGYEVAPMMQVCMDINECEAIPGKKQNLLLLFNLSICVSD